jgi:hypothetical protein
MKVLVPVQPVQTVAEKVNLVRGRITRKAFEHLMRGETALSNVEQYWADAKKSLIYEPFVEVRESVHGVWVVIHCPELDFEGLRLFASARELLVVAPLKEPERRWLFRTIRFRAAIEVEDCTCEFAGDRIFFTASSRNLPDERKVHFQVA